MASWWSRHRTDVARDVAAGLIVSVPVAVGVAFLDARTAARQERQNDFLADQAIAEAASSSESQEIIENVRFVRERASEITGLRPFQGLNLKDAQLGGLPLGCDVEDTEKEGCADFRGANLDGADFVFTDLTGADLSGASIQGTSFFFADLSRVEFGITDMSGTVLAGADLRGANMMLVQGFDQALFVLNDADSVDWPCFDDTTIWPLTLTRPELGQEACDRADRETARILVLQLRERLAEIGQAEQS